uniref:C3H1-type domain-containing protein n=1 Tax=Arion vulgaris TaxID=1028688 RepID=A0A0B6ZLN0_9EUPU
MGKRYYCEYCDKSFADNPISRKTHLTGNSHLQIRKAHYDALRDEKDILNEDRNKKPCRAYLSTGECKFGDRCQYSHLTNEDRARLSDHIAVKEELTQSRLRGKSNSKTDLKESLNKWTENLIKRQKLEKDMKEEPDRVKTREIYLPEYKLAECLQSFPNIPPSLLPPERKEILSSHYVEWGW